MLCINYQVQISEEILKPLKEKVNKGVLCEIHIYNWTSNNRLCLYYCFFLFSTVVSKN